MHFRRPLYIFWWPARKFLTILRSIICLGIVFLCGSGSPFAPGGLTFLNCNEGTGSTAADFSGNSHNATLTNGPTWVAGKYGQAISFDGSNDYLSIPDHTDFSLSSSQSYTWSAWVKNNNFNSWGTVWSQTADNSNYFYFYAHSTTDAEAGPVTNGITVYWSNNGNAKLVVHSNDNVISSAAWNYITITYDANLAQSNRFTIYVNGADVTNRNDIVSSGNISSINPNSIRIGGNQPFGDYLNGAVDEVRYYNRLLSLSEIQSDMNTPMDNTPPTISISSPLNATTVSGTININADASDNVGVVGVQFLLDGVNFGSEDNAAPYSITWNTTATTDGNHVLTAKARDLAGNITTSSAINVTVNNDLIAPTISLTAPAAGLLAGTIDVTATATDNIGVTGVQFLLNGNNLGTEDPSEPYSLSWNTTTVNDGQYTLSAKARDAAGNITTSTGVNVIVHNTVDSQSPSVTLTAPSGGTVTGTINVIANASDNIAVAGVQFRLDGADLGDEDIAAPYSVTWNTLSVTDGIHVLSARARDLDGNTATSLSINVTVFNQPDNEPPTITVISPVAGIIAGTIDINASANDNIGMAGVQFLLNGINLGNEDTVAPYSYSWNTTGLPDGNYILAARGRDIAGNLTTTTNTTVTVRNDSQAPSVSLTAPTAGNVSGTITVSANASDNIGVAGVQFLLNGSNLSTEDQIPPYSVSWNTRTLSNGSYTLTARARDGSGNLQTSSAVNVTILNLPPDSEYPAVSITSPSAGEIAGVINVTANATDNVGIVGVQFYLNGTELGAEDLSAPYNYSWNTFLATNGSYILTAITHDAAGNFTTSDAVTVNVNNAPDTELPTIGFLSPAAGNVTGTITARANASDNIAVVGVQFLLDGNNLGPEDLTAPYTVVWNTSNATEGNHTLSARARDASGNMSLVAFVSVNVVINYPPSIAGVSVNTISPNSAIITWTTNVPSTSQVLYNTTTNYSLSTLTDATPVTSHSMMLMGLAPNTLYHYQAVSTDSNGVGRSTDFTFTTTGLAATLGTLNQHTVLAFPTGKIIPWTPNPLDGYTTVMDLAWNYLLNVVPNDPLTGKPAYYSRSYIDPNTQAMVTWPHNPAGLYGMLAESAIKYYPYSGNSNVMQLATDVALWHLDHGMTLPADNWPGVPYASGDVGSLIYNGADVGNSSGQGDGDGYIEPDKIGELGNAWLQLYKYGGDTRFKDAAIQAANVLSSKIRPGTISQSPWPFRVNAHTGAVREDYCSNMIPPISLLDNLIACGFGDTATYRTARNIVWTWMMTYPMVNNVWAQYFEDVSVQSNYNGNLNQYNAMMVARYLLEHPEFDPNWEAHVRGLITWVETNFGETSFGALAIREQEDFFYSMGSHTSRYASVNALLYEKTGDLAAKEKAYRSFNWATYMARSNGVVIDGPDVNNQWFTDGYGDYVRHFMTGLAAVPEWVPFNQTRLLRSSSVIKDIAYGINNVTYSTYDTSSTEILHLNFTPLTVRSGNVVLPRRADLNGPGWTLDVATKTMKIYHKGGTNISVSSVAPTAVCPGESVYFTVAKPGTDYTYQWQIDSTGGSFVNLVSNAIHSGVNTDTLWVIGAPTSYYGYKYRCVVSKNGTPLNGPVYELKFRVEWQGGASSDWEDSSNWSCNYIPDANTDVLIPGTSNNHPVINTSTSVHSIILSAGSNLTVGPGIRLDVKGK